jgi:hypothetical protein
LSHFGKPCNCSIPRWGNLLIVLTDRDSLVYYCDKLGFGALEIATASGVCGEDLLYDSGLRLLILLDGNVIVDARY